MDSNQHLRKRVPMVRRIHKQVCGIDVDIMRPDLNARIDMAEQFIRNRVVTINIVCARTQ